MKLAKKIVSLMLTIAMLLSMSVSAFAVTTTAAPSDKDETPLVVGYSPFSSKFSPFFAQTAYDQDVAGMTGLGLIGTDRLGNIIYNGIEGEVHPYNGTDYTYKGVSNLVVTENADGTVFYDIELAKDLVFSDGTPITIDDVIFSMYVLCDPTYDGSSSMFALPIEGMDAYRTGMESLYSLILAAGADNTDYTLWTAEQQADFWADVEQAGAQFAQEIVDYCMANYASYGAKDVATSAALWGFDLDAKATAEDFWAAIVEAYDGDIATATKTETAGSSLLDFMEKAEVWKAGVETGDAAQNISGIQKIDDYNLRVVATKVDATMVYQLGITIAPLHYYGDVAKFNYDENKFGFDKGDLSSVRAVTTQPLGAGPYKFIKFEDGVVSFEANENYYKGCPKTKYINFLETQEADKLNGIVTGTIDVTDPSYNKDVAKAIDAANNGTGANGDVITTSMVTNLGYGYIAMNAKNVNVGGVIDSTESKNLRKAFATVFAVYRDVAIDSYYGEYGQVINYPISTTSWAAPVSSDDGYQVAFSVDVDGNPIYTSAMTAEERYAAALQAALGFFAAAGYTVADGKVTAAPEGASLEYEIMIPADGAGDHPSFMILTLVRDALATIGINLIVNDLTNSSDLWDALDAHTCAMWCAAWGSTIDPDMFQIYYSDVANGGLNPGGSNYEYDIADATLDEMIMLGRSSLDQEFRKTIYKGCLDIILDWGVEVPVYQRSNVIIFSTERVNLDTVTPDITPFWGWMSEIELVELK